MTVPKGKSFIIVVVDIIDFSSFPRFYFSRHSVPRFYFSRHCVPMSIYHISSQFTLRACSFIVNLVLYFTLILC